MQIDSPSSLSIFALGSIFKRSLRLPKRFSNVAVSTRRERSRPPVALGYLVYQAMLLGSFRQVFHGDAGPEFVVAGLVLVAQQYVPGGESVFQRVVPDYRGSGFA